MTLSYINSRTINHYLIYSCTPIGNLSNGKNCWISYIRRDDGIYKLVSPPDSTQIGLNHRMLS